MEKQISWVLDPNHSELTFKVKHLMISNVKGAFKSFEASILTEGNDFNDAVALASIEVNSISTNSEDRDKHLLNDDFFDAGKFPGIEFKGTGLTRYDEENGQLKGSLTIKGVTKEVNFDVEFGGVSTDPWGNVKAGFALQGRINRSDFGLTWNANLETGGVLLSDEVKINADLQFLKRA